MFTQVKHFYQNFFTSSKDAKEMQFSFFESYEFFTYSLEIEPASQGIIEIVTAGNSSKFSISWDEDFFLNTIDGVLSINQKAAKIIDDAGIIVPQAFINFSDNSLIETSKTLCNAINRH